MQVENRLAGCGVSIDDGAVPRPIDALLFCSATHNGQHVTKKNYIVSQIIVQRRDMFARYDQQVNGSLLHNANTTDSFNLSWKHSGFNMALNLYRSETNSRIAEILTPEQRPGWERLLAESGARGQAATGRVYVLDGIEPKPRDVRLGLTDGSTTEVVAGELAEGTEVIIGAGGPASQPAGGGPGALHAFSRELAVWVGWRVRIRSVLRDAMPHEVEEHQGPPWPGGWAAGARRGGAGSMALDFPASLL